MSFEGIVQIAQEDNLASVNRALTKGWELLSVNSLGEGLVYTIGRRADKADKKDPMEGFALGEHTKQS